MKRWLLGSVVLGGLALGLPAACDFRIGPVAHCHYGGETYVSGEHFPASDGCNSCSCGSYGDVACTAMACLSCAYDGDIYQVGDTFPSDDGCALCSCEWNGAVSCEPVGCSVGCAFGGPRYAVGDVIDAGDGCNSCSCTAQGLACTEMACACDPEREYARVYIAFAPEDCARLDYACPANSAAFANACGCGCEQWLACPEAFDCMPGPGAVVCDVAALHALCPYSAFAF